MLLTHIICPSHATDNTARATHWALLGAPGLPNIFSCLSRVTHWAQRGAPGLPNISCYTLGTAGCHETTQHLVLHTGHCGVPRDYPTSRVTLWALWGAPRLPNILCCLYRVTHWAQRGAPGLPNFSCYTLGTAGCPETTQHLVLHTGHCGVPRDYPTSCVVYIVLHTGHCGVPRALGTAGCPGTTQHLVLSISGYTLGTAACPGTTQHLVLSILCCLSLVTL
ncbi:hypothetical protein ACOMHN_060512 [Nucella lapillus]